MPPARPTSASQQLVRTGPKHVSVRTKNDTAHRNSAEKPTTARALVLRNGKHGARGTGELILVKKLSGREKLDLLAEDLVLRSTKAVMSPFRLEQCLKIVESQRNTYFDDINNLRDPQLFVDLIQEELNARTRNENNKTDPSYVASTVATRIHNTYVLASAWKLVSETLYDLADRGVNDGAIKSQLKNNREIRARYLLLYDLVNTLVNMNQAKFSLLATTAPHYARYFKEAETSDPGQRKIIFDCTELRAACLSFLDSIIIELCFPRAPYPKIILYQILHDAVEESPKEARRFPQALWDAVGDLSVAVELQQLLEAPLLGPEGQSWKDAPREMPKDYEDWIDAQLYSSKASSNSVDYEDIIFPLEKTKNKDVLETMWKYINLNYKMACGEDMDTLWGLTDVLEPVPQWHSVYTLDLGTLLDSDDDNRPGLSKKKRPLLISNVSANDGGDSMPGLQTVSNSSDEAQSDDSNDDSDHAVEDEDDSDSGYDTEQEVDFREMLKEAMDIAHEAGWLQSVEVDEGLDPLVDEDRRGNTFLKLLGSLRGRFFSGDSKLKTTTRTEPLQQKLGRSVNQTAAPLQKAERTPPATPSPKPKPADDEPQSYKVRVEEIDDGDDVPVTITKKKKKKTKKKKPAFTDPQQAEIPRDSLPFLPHSPRKGPQPTIPSPSLSPSSNNIPAPKLGSQKMSPIVSSSSFGSTSSLPLVSETTAQSARSYLQAGNLDKEKAKIKSRPNRPTTFGAEPKKKISMFSKIMGRGKTEDEEPKEGKRKWFYNLGKKSKDLLHQLLRTSEDDTRGLKPMKWEDFLRVMKDMGFEIDPSAAGSSVRFDPADKRDGPITFHKPHPDTTLYPVKLKQYAKRLKDRYGWDAKDILTRA